ncbi:hypothetical protein RKE29_28455 [Streptomyces sp. B1866]|uniref:hypothetical protein n=1 Tax=Streptomyces sp. B1866 TaxID=3075431 RepID=UPI00288D4C10|nr:hypothetical protein [Streptomyces sp. B1866]MDT3400494.1 hypothetical protein [Streptomyces sp. B1866]
MAVPAPLRSAAADPGRAQVRLPWWALLLPVLAFAALLLFAGPRAHATGDGGAAAHRLGPVLHALDRLVS